MLASATSLSGCSRSAPQHLWSKLCVVFFAESQNSRAFSRHLAISFQARLYYLWSLTCPCHPVLSLTWHYPHVTQESIKGLASLTSSFACQHLRHAVTSLTRLCTHITQGPISARGFKHLIFRLHIGLGPEQQFAKLRVTIVRCVVERRVAPLH